MSSSSFAKTKKGYHVGAILFLVVLLVLFTVAAVISYPKNKAINLSKAEPSIFLEPSANWYKISEGCYQVLNEFGKYTVSDSTFLFPRTYYYFNVLVEKSNGEDFIIAVRAGDKAELLREGHTPELYGMISELDDSEIDNQLENYSASSDLIYHVCLNDNDTNVSINYRNSIIFGLVALADILMILRIILRMH